jgi:hypothetical protein
MTGNLLSYDCCTAGLQAGSTRLGCFVEVGSLSFLFPRGVAFGGEVLIE